MQKRVRQRERCGEWLGPGAGVHARIGPRACDALVSWSMSPGDQRMPTSATESPTDRSSTAQSARISAGQPAAISSAVASSGTSKR